MFAAAVLAGCASSEEPKDAKPESKPSPSAEFKCVPLEKSVVKHFQDGAVGPKIRPRHAEAVKLPKPVTPADSPKPKLNYAVAFRVATPDGEQVALIATEKLDGGGFTLAADETARKLFIFGADITDDSPVGLMGAEVASSSAAEAARACL